MQCQHCDHLHYGVGEHPLPKLDNQIFCQGCAQNITIDTMRAVPLVDDPESMLVLTRHQVSWQRVREIGFLNAWWGVFKMVLAAPSQLIRRCFPEDVWSDAYIFALATTGLGLLAHFFSAVGWFALIGRSTPRWC